MKTPKAVFLRIEYDDIDPRQSLAPGTPVTLEEMTDAFGSDRDATIVSPPLPRF